ncbi:MFS transporter [Arthrobacter sp. K5]|uniref:MFS transporter n=1 Tax=Arthrobacter sp. K5 TaxID=2839623 RepID=A0AAU8EZ50_9MICC
MSVEVQRRTKTKSGKAVLALCFFSIVAEGYDMVAYGTSLPSMLADPSLGLTAVTAGLIGSYVLVGMLVGSVGMGLIADFVGRRKLVIASTVWFSAWMVVCALAPNITVFGFARFLVGVGVGALIPTAAALAVEFAPKGRGNTYSAIMWVGYPTGGLLAALLGLVVLGPFGPKGMFLIGALPLITIVPLALRFLPESPAFLNVRGRHEEALAIAERYGLESTLDEADAPSNADSKSTTRRGPLALFTKERRLSTVFIGLLSGCGLFLTYGLNTWLPQLMRASGYELGSALTFLLVLNAGAIIVPLFASRIADRIGPRLVVAAAFGAASVAICLLSIKGATPFLLLLTFVAGAGTIGAQTLVYGFAATHFPTSCRAAGTAWTASVGRIGGIIGPSLTGLLMAGGAPTSTAFFALGAIAVVGAAIAATVPRVRS